MAEQKIIPRICQECGIDFLALKSAVKRGYGKFCSRVCQNRVNGRKMRKLHPLGESGKTKAQSKAYKAIQRAIERGDFERPHKCEKCCAEGKVHGHHHDYSKPLDVQWLCPKCHIHVHLYGEPTV